MKSFDWAAGLFEGEGCVTIARQNTGGFTSDVGRCRPSLSLGMTDRDIVEEFAEVMGCGFMGERPWHANNGHKPSWRWQTKSNREVAECIDRLYPLMGPRRRARMDEVRELLIAKKARRRELGLLYLTGASKGAGNPNV